MNNTLVEDNKIECSWITNVMYGLVIFSLIPADLSANNKWTWMLVAVLTLIASATIFFKGDLKHIYGTAGILIAAIFVFNFVVTKEYLHTKRLNEHYSLFLNKNENYANTENAKKIRTALEHYNDENTDIAYEVLNNKDQNISQDIDKVINLTNAIKQLTPELKDELKLAMADNFVSLEEYNQLKDKTLKHISLATLTNEQLVLLGSIK